MPSEFRSGRKKPVSVKKSYFVRYFVTATVPQYELPDGEHNWRGDEETADVGVFDVVIDAHRASQARRTASYILPIVAESKGIEPIDLNFTVKPLDDYVTELSDLVAPLLEARRKLVTGVDVAAGQPETKEEQDDGNEDGGGRPTGPEGGCSGDERDVPGDSTPGE